MKSQTPDLNLIQMADSSLRSFFNRNAFLGMWRRNVWKVVTFKLKYSVQDYNASIINLFKFCCDISSTWKNKIVSHSYFIVEQVALFSSQY